MQTQFWHETKILEVVTGSHGYGLASPQSDLDLRGICMLPAEYLLGLQRFEQGMGPGEDQVTYALPKFVALALDANPNILELQRPETLAGISDLAQESQPGPGGIGGAVRLRHKTRHAPVPVDGNGAGNPAGRRGLR